MPRGNPIILSNIFLLDSKSHFPRNKNLKIHLLHDSKWFFMILNYSLKTYLR